MVVLTRRKKIKNMNKIQKELYQAPELTKFELDNELSILLTFSIEGSADSIEGGIDDGDDLNSSKW